MPTSIQSPTIDSESKYSDVTLIGNNIQWYKEYNQKQCHTCIVHAHYLVKMPKMWSYSYQAGDICKDKYMHGVGTA